MLGSNFINAHVSCTTSLLTKIVNRYLHSLRSRSAGLGHISAVVHVISVNDFARSLYISLALILTNIINRFLSVHFCHVHWSYLDCGMISAFVLLKSLFYRDLYSIWKSVTLLYSNSHSFLSCSYVISLFKIRPIYITFNRLHRRTLDIHIQLGPCLFHSQAIKLIRTSTKYPQRPDSNHASSLPTSL